jgi:exopolysaccharide production protein ExoY
VENCCDEGVRITSGAAKRARTMNKTFERFEFRPPERLQGYRGSGIAEGAPARGSKAPERRRTQTELVGPNDGLPLWKRVLDMAIILALAPALLFISAFVALLVKFSSPGPILFRQRRIGFSGREFVCFKFRTMKVDAETGTHRDHTRNLITSKEPMIKLDARDPRLTPFGTALRASGLDELPQLLNVLRGEMSIVGPRPCLRYEYELYGERERRRFEATPGLTGLWQVSGKNRTTFEEMIDFDIQYAETKSLWLDLAIICKTLPALWVQCMDTRASRQTKAIPTNRIPKSIQFNNL